MPFAKTVELISPKSIYARIKEEMKSYFNTGAIDDLMFPEWTLDCISAFKATYLPIQEAVIDICNYKAELPCDFKLVREVWVCATVNKGPITSPFTFYYQTDCRINTITDSCNECTAPECNPTNGCATPDPVNLPLPNLCDLNLNSSGPCVCSTGDQFRVTHKVQTHLSFGFTVQGMLKPGNYKTINRCWDKSPNKQCNTIDSFDIMNHNIVTSFNTGTLFLLYYANPLLDDDGYYDIPDVEEFKKYVYYYIRFMIYQMLFDQSTDESFNQIKAKRDDAEARLNIALVKAKNEAMAQTVYDVQKAIIRSYNKNRRFIIK